MGPSRRPHGLKDILSSDPARVLFATFVVMLVAALFSPYFLTVSNVGSVLHNQAIIGAMAIGELFVMVLGGMDISIGSVFGIAGTVASLILAAGQPAALAVLAGLSCGVLVGLGNGLLIARVKMAPFIVTLGASGIVRGVNLVLTGATSRSIEDPSFLALDTASLFRLPLPILLIVFFCALTDLFLKKTAIGGRFYAIGGDEEAARKLGIDVEGIQILAYVLCSSFAALAGILGAAKVSASYPLAGSGYEFEVIAAVVIGGALMEGGKGTAFCSILGSIFIGMLKSGILQLGVSQYWQQALNGFAILFVLIVSMNVFKKRDARYG